MCEFKVYFRGIMCQNIGSRSYRLNGFIKSFSCGCINLFRK